MTFYRAKLGVFFIVFLVALAVTIFIILQDSKCEIVQKEVGTLKFNLKNALSCNSSLEGMSQQNLLSLVSESSTKKTQEVLANFVHSLKWSAEHDAQRLSAAMQGLSKKDKYEMFQTTADESNCYEQYAGSPNGNFFNACFFHLETVETKVDFLLDSDFKFGDSKKYIKNGKSLFFTKDESLMISDEESGLKAHLMTPKQAFGFNCPKGTFTKDKMHQYLVHDANKFLPEDCFMITQNKISFVHMSYDFNRVDQLEKVNEVLKIHKSLLNEVKFQELAWKKLSLNYESVLIRNDQIEISELFPFGGIVHHHDEMLGAAVGIKYVLRALEKEGAFDRHYQSITDLAWDIDNCRLILNLPKQEDYFAKVMEITGVNPSFKRVCKMEPEMECK